MSSQQQDEQRRNERRRFRAATAAHLAAALVRVWNEDHPNALKLSAEAVRLADALMERLEQTEDDS